MRHIALATIITAAGLGHAAPAGAWSKDRSHSTAQRGKGICHAAVDEIVPVVDMHKRSGLAEACFNEPKADGIVRAMRDLYDSLLWRGEKVPLAGSGVSHFDRLVLAAQYPFIAERLTYWSLDLGPIRRLAEGTGHGDLALRADPAGVAHRAEADVRRAQAEFSWWRTVLSAAACTPPKRDAA